MRGGVYNLIHEFIGSKDLVKFIQFSSTAAMGPIGLPILNEESKPNPKTPYQKSKRRSELICLEAFKRNNFPCLIVRPCMVYGIGGYGQFYKFCTLMKKGFFPKVGIGKNLTPLVNVEDVTDATILTLNNGIIGSTYLIASKTSITMDYLHHLIVRNIGAHALYIYVPSFVALFAARIIEWLFPKFGMEPPVTHFNIRSTITDRTFDISKAENELGYHPKVSFEEGIRDVISWYKEMGKI